jgi:hypothetical protein
MVQPQYRGTYGKYGLSIARHHSTQAAAGDYVEVLYFFLIISWNRDPLEDIPSVGT